MPNPSQSRPILLIRNISLSAYGGGETYQLRLATALRKQGFQPIIVTSSRPLAQNASREQFRAISAPYFRRQNWSGWRNLLLPVYILWELRLYFWYKKLFRNLTPLAIDIQSRDDWIAASLAALHLNRHTSTPIKIFWTDHMDFRSWVLTNVTQKHKNPIAKYILKIAPRVDKIIFISDFERNFFEQTTAHHPLHNLITIKNGALDCSPKNGSLNLRNIGYIGRLVDYKGINELLAAFISVHSAHPDAHLHIYGSGAADLVAKAKQTKGVIYHGFTDQPLKAIRSCGIFVLPSYFEGLSLSLVDAAMLSRAIVATNVDGNPEVVIDGQTGLLVPPRNSSALAAALNRLLDRPRLAHQLAQNARRHFETDFNFEHNIKQQFLPLLELDSSITRTHNREPNNA